MPDMTLCADYDKCKRKTCSLHPARYAIPDGHPVEWVNCMGTDECRKDKDIMEHYSDKKKNKRLDGHE